jgi:endonuclease/exonuclease/phosphatase family metal-dependent hydrolase
MYTRLPVESKRAITLRPDCLPVLEMVVRVGTERLTVRTMHPPSPQNGTLWSERNDFLARAARELEWDERTILLADLNTSSGSPAFADLVEATHLCDSRRGFGRLPTWHTDRPIAGLWVDIDHILVGTRVRVLERGTDPIPGSDHCAATARLAIEPR